MTIISIKEGIWMSESNWTIPTGYPFSARSYYQKLSSGYILSTACITL
jgi:hypothetical protein